MNELLDQFHFLRPYYLLLIPLMMVACWWLRHKQQQSTGFEQWIDPDLLQYLSIDPEETTHEAVSHEENSGESGQDKSPTSASLKSTLSNTARQYWPYFLMALIGIITAVALAGPTWKQLPQTLHESEAGLVIVLDLSPSMNAQDNKPSRIARARIKIKDLLGQRKDGLTGLVVYAGEAHVVSPLTDDTRTISHLLATLEPGLLPIPGSNIEMAIATAKQLVSDAGLNQASIVIVTDGIDPDAFSTIEKLLDNQFTPFILGVGTTAGAPIPTSNGFLKDGAGKVVRVARNDQQLQQLAQRIGGQFIPLQANDSDIQTIIDGSDQPETDARELERDIDQWHEFGPTLLLLVLPLMALGFRRGWIVVMAISITPLMYSENGYALTWQDLWLNDEQQGQQAFEKEQYDSAQEHFTNTQWQGSSAYRQQDYQAAIDAFSQGNSAEDHYNRGNALAQSGKLEEAMNAYDQALSIDKSLTQAQENRDVVEKALKQKQEQQQQNQQQDGDSQEQDQKQSQKQEQQQDQNSDQQNKSQQDSSSQDQQSQTDEASKQEQEQSEAEKAEQSAQAADDENNNNADEQNDGAEQRPLPSLNKEEQQALEQWIRKVPDDPSGLLRRKFEYEFQKRRQEYRSGEWELPDNNAHTRY